MWTFEQNKKEVKIFIYYIIDVVLTTFLASSCCTPFFGIKKKKKTTFLAISINWHFVIKLVEILAFSKYYISLVALVAISSGKIISNTHTHTQGTLPHTSWIDCKQTEVCASSRVLQKKLDIYINWRKEK